VDSIATQCGGPNTINVYCEGLTWHNAFFNLEQPFSYVDIRETFSFIVKNNKIIYYKNLTLASGTERNV
jgi:hypothetical protein